MKILLMLLISCVVTSKAIAQNDSLDYSSAKTVYVDNTHDLKLKQFIAPTVCLGVGILN